MESTDIILTIFKATSRIATYGRLLFRHCVRCSHFLLRVSRTKRLASVTTLLMLCLTGIAPSSAITLTSSSETATAGYFQLSWQAEQATDEFVLQEATRADFTTAKILYRGADRATVISGKPDNVYYYQVRSQANPANISNTVKVTVAHHPLRNAFGFFSVGAFVFIATLLLIFLGNRQGH